MDSTPPETAGPRPMSFLAAAGWTLLVVVLYAVGLGVAEGLREGAITDLVTHTTCRALACSIALFLILRVHEPEGSIRRVLALRAPPLLTIPLSIFVGLALAGPSAWLDKVMLARFPYSESDQEALEKLFGPAAYETTSKKIALVATMVVLMPMLDELFFRGAIFTPLRKGRRLDSVILATAVYETFSSSPHIREMITAIVLALAMSTIRGLSGSSIPSIAARIAFFAPQFIPTAIGKELPPLDKKMLLASAGAAVLSFLGIVMVCRRDRRGLDETLLEDG